MRRLLLPLLASLLLPVACAAPNDKSKEDIVVKTDLEETYIVKDSTVTIKPWSKLEAIVQLQKNHPVQTCRDRLKKRTYFTEAEKETSLQGCYELLYSDGVTNHLEKEKILLNSNISTPIHIVRFRPIFIDLNNKKTANTYYETACINYSEISKLDSGDKDNYIAGLAYSLSKIEADLPDIDSNLALEFLKEKVCLKYNDFEESEFSINDPLIKKKKYVKN